MLEGGFPQLIMLIIGTAVFMLAGLLVCIGISIFTDTINKGGAFGSIGEKVIAVIFVPFLLVAKLIDIVISFFTSKQIKRGLNSKV